MKVIVYRANKSLAKAKYHTDETCRFIPGNWKKIDEEVAKEWGAEKCKNCADNWDRDVEQNWDYQRALKEASE